METSIAISIISSSTALIVAGLSAALNARNQKKSSLELEQLKARIAEEVKMKEADLKTKNEFISAIDRVLEHTQKIKDSLFILTHDLRIRENFKIEFVTKTKQQISEYAEVFSENFSKFGEPEAGIIHSLKNSLFQLDYSFDELIYSKKADRILDFSKFTEEISEVRSQIGEVQQSLLIRRVNPLNRHEKDSYR